MVKSLLKPFNAQLKEEGRECVVPYLHETIEELIIIPSAKSVCPNVQTLQGFPLVWNAESMENRF